MHANTNYVRKFSPGVIFCQLGQLGQLVIIINLASPNVSLTTHTQPTPVRIPFSTTHQEENPILVLQVLAPDGKPQQWPLA